MHSMRIAGMRRSNLLNPKSPDWSSLVCTCHAWNIRVMLRNGPNGPNALNVLNAEHAWSSRACRACRDYRAYRELAERREYRESTERVQREYRESRFLLIEPITNYYIKL